MGIRLLLIGIGLLGAAQQNPGNPPDDPSFRSPPPEVTGEVSFPVQTPNPMGWDDFERTATLLQLAPPQRLFAERAWEDYRTRTRELVRSALAELWRRSYAAAGAYTPKATPDYPQLLQALSDYEDAVAKSMTSFDNAFFSELESILSDEQKQQMSRVRQRRARQFCFFTDSVFSVFDISRWLERVLTPEELQVIDAQLLAYENAITPLYSDLHRRMRFQRHRAAESLAGLSWAADRGDGGAYQAHLAELKEGYAPIIAIEHRVSDLNNASAEKMFVSLGRDRGDAVRDIYLSSSYSPLFPDVLDARPIFLVARTIPDTPVVSAELQSLYDAYRAQHFAVSKELMEGYDRIREFRGLNLHYQMDDDTRTSMRTLREKRWKLDIDFVRSLTNRLPAQPGSEWQKALTEYSRIMSKVEEVSKSDAFPFK